MFTTPEYIRSRYPRLEKVSFRLGSGFLFNTTDATVQLKKAVFRWVVVAYYDELVPIPEHLRLHVGPVSFTDNCYMGFASSDEKLEMILDFFETISTDITVRWSPSTNEILENFIAIAYTDWQLPRTSAYLVSNEDELLHMKILGMGIMEFVVV